MSKGKCKVIITTNSFFKDLIDLSKQEQKQTAKTIRLMEENIKHPSLQCHSVDNTPYHEVYVNKELRLIFEISTESYVLFCVIHHDELYKL